MPLKQLPKLTLSRTAMSVLETAEANDRLTLVGSTEELVKLAVPQKDEQGYFNVGYDIPGKGWVNEVRVCNVKNGISANYVEPYMRRRDPDCMVIADERATDKPVFKERFGKDFGPIREEAIEWLKSQPIAAFFFSTGLPDKPINGVAICPANAGFFGLGLAQLQGILPLEEVNKQGENFFHSAIIYTVPPFRHTHFDGKQVVVHNRRLEDKLHELFSFNLYPGPSAKKGVYGMLLTAGEASEERWTTAHCSTVQVITPYDSEVTIMHEGASGGGKSEMLEHMHRKPDGTLKLGENLITGEDHHILLPLGCQLNPVTDDMALCHPDLQDKSDKVRRLGLIDAEQAWFIRVNHITEYGTDPNLEKQTINPKGPLLFLNIDAQPDSTALIWNHIQDEPGKPCPNPRVVLPRKYVPDVVSKPVKVDIRSFGVRCPPCTKENPTYGIMGMFHILPPSLAWLWRLTAPRGHGNPSIVDTGGMKSEGVGSYWPFATGRRVDQANILLDQIFDTNQTLFILVPNQHIGAWKVDFAPQWIVREFLARRGGSSFRPDKLVDSRCALLGQHLEQMQVEGQTISKRFFDVSKQAQVEEAGYDAGAKILQEFFMNELKNFDHPDLSEKGKNIIQACRDGATVSDYIKLSV